MVKEKIKNNASGNTVYGMGFVGALIYYVSHAAGLWTGLLGILKAIFWPGFLVYEVLSHLGV